jgi:hypothetical protein
MEDAGGVVDRLQPVVRVEGQGVDRVEGAGTSEDQDRAGRHTLGRVLRRPARTGRGRRLAEQAPKGRFGHGARKEQAIAARAPPGADGSVWRVRELVGLAAAQRQEKDLGRSVDRADERELVAVRVPGGVGDPVSGAGKEPRFGPAVRRGYEELRSVFGGVAGGRDGPADGVGDAAARWRQGYVLNLVHVEQVRGLKGRRGGLADGHSGK